MSIDWGRWEGGRPQSGRAVRIYPQTSELPESGSSADCCCSSWEGVVKTEKRPPPLHDVQLLCPLRCSPSAPPPEWKEKFAWPNEQMERVTESRTAIPANALSMSIQMRATVCMYAKYLTCGSYAQFFLR